jgi:hypothetical protein
MSEKQGDQLAGDLSGVRDMLATLLSTIYDESVSVWVARAVEDLKAAEALVHARDLMNL